MSECCFVYILICFSSCVFTIRLYDKTALLMFFEALCIRSYIYEQVIQGCRQEALQCKISTFVFCCASLISLISRL